MNHYLNTSALNVKEPCEATIASVELAGNHRITQLENTLWKEYQRRKRRREIRLGFAWESRRGDQEREKREENNDDDPFSTEFGTNDP
jgi:hypothetical protein